MSKKPISRSYVHKIHNITEKEVDEVGADVEYSQVGFMIELERKW